MRIALFKHFVHSSRSRSAVAAAAATNSPLPFSFSSRRHAVSASLAEDEAETVVFPREGPGVSYGLNWALAGRGVIVKDKAFHNLKSSELQQKGATTSESLSGLPVHVRGNVVRGALEISKAQFSKLLKQVTSHLSSISPVFVQDGAVGSSPKYNAKSEYGDIIDLGSEGKTGFHAADIERSSLILCGKAFSDTNGTKDALAALAGPIVSARGGIPLSARLLMSGDTIILLFAPEDAIRSCSDSLVSGDAGVILTSQGVAPLFQTRDSGAPNLLKLPSAVVLASADSSGILPSVSKLSPGQAAYHFLAGYQNGKFVPAYNKGPSSIDPLELAKAFLSKLEENKTPSFLININEGEKCTTGKDLINLVQSTLVKNVPPFEPKGGNLQGKYKSFLSSKYQELPQELSF